MSRGYEDFQSLSLIRDYQNGGDFVISSVVLSATETEVIATQLTPGMIYSCGLRIEGATAIPVFRVLVTSNDHFVGVFYSDKYDQFDGYYGEESIFKVKHISYIDYVYAIELQKSIIFDTNMLIVIYNYGPGNINVYGETNIFQPVPTLIYAP